MSAEAQVRPAVAGAAAGNEGAETAAPKRKAPLRLYALIGIVLLALGGGGWFFLARMRTHAEVPAAEAKPPEPVKVTAPLGSLVVNIGAPETRRFLKVGVDLGVSDEKAAKEVEEHKAQILDLLISVLADSVTRGAGVGRRAGEPQEDRSRADTRGAAAREGEPRVFHRVPDPVRGHAWTRSCRRTR